jgi:voltage-gated potassium channel
MAADQPGPGGLQHEVLGSPLQMLVATLVYVGVLFVLATLGYMAAGWTLGDSAYMVLLTIFSVGFGEVHPIDTMYLRTLTSITIVLGCTGMIVLTGALVQVFTLFQFRRMMGTDRMMTDIQKLQDHVIICGFGRIGVQLAKALGDARRGFVVIERDPAKADEARAHGMLVLLGEATDEETLKLARIERASVLATVLPDDAANVFITLSARSLNPGIEIIARGEAPTTENKLFHAGADKVVLPTHIGAERIVEMILYPATVSVVAGSPEMAARKRALQDLGLDLEAVTASANGALTGKSVGEAERRGSGAFFVVQIDRPGGVRGGTYQAAQSITHPGEDVTIEPDDAVLLVVRGSRLAVGALFTMPATRMRSGRGA